MTAHPITIAPQHDLDYFDDRGNPDLQKLVQIFRGYNKIPQWAWTKWDADNIEFQKRRRLILPPDSKSAVTVAVPKTYPASDECCRCHQHGAFGYRAKTLAQMGVTDPVALDGSDDLVWFCDAHKPATHFTDARRP
jgi:hypothetical protein